MPFLVASTHSSNDVDEIVPVLASEESEIVESPADDGLDLDEGSSGRLTPLSPHSLSQMIIDTEERQQLRSGFRPIVSTNFERLSGSAMVFLQSPAFVATKTSVIFKIERIPDTFVSYQVSCFDIDKGVIQPLLKDYWFLRRLADKQLRTKAYSLSASTSLPRQPTLKTNFRMTPAGRNMCVADGGQVRFMLT